jgi:hypothetical protein
MVITGVRNTYGDFASQLKADFTGPGNFTYWVASIGAVGAVGYVDKLRPFANMFMALIIIVMVLKNGGVFDKFRAALASGGTTPAQTPSQAPAQAPAQQQGSNTTGNVAQYAEMAAMVFGA